MDLSGAYHKEGMGDFGWLLCLRKLVSLTLHNVQGRSLYECKYVKYAILNTVISDVEDSLQTLCKLVDLQHLDISQCNESRGQFKSPVLFMERLVVSLPCLRSLDISGTNLAGAGGDRGTKEDRHLCDIAGMETRWAGGSTAGGWVHILRYLQSAEAAGLPWFVQDSQRCQQQTSHSSKLCFW